MNKYMENYEKLIKDFNNIERNISIKKFNFNKCNQNIFKINKSFDELSEKIKGVNINLLNLSHHLNSHNINQYSKKPRSRIRLVVRSLPSRESIRLVSTFYKINQTIEIYLEYFVSNLIPNSKHSLGFIFNGKFRPHNVNQDDLNTINWCILAKTVMFTNIVSQSEGPIYEQIKNDSFWAQFLLETEQLYTIVMVDLM